MKEPIKSNGKAVDEVFGVKLDAQGKIIRQPVDMSPGDYGCDPLGDGMFRMVPSGDVVTSEEKERRLASRRKSNG